MPNISVGRAVKIAKEQAEMLFEGESLRNLALEEVELDEAKSQWLITLGFDSPHILRRKTGPNLFPTTEEERKREYKVFRINADDGALVSRISGTQYLTSNESPHFSRNRRYHEPNKAIPDDLLRRPLNCAV